MSELRTAIENRRTVSAGMWTYLEDKGFWQEAIDEAMEDPVGYLIAEIDNISAAAAERATPGGGIPYSKSFEYLDGYERERFEVRGEVLAKHASSNRAVQAFRDRFLGGELLSPEQSQAFVTSLANQHLPVEWFFEQQVSFLDHTSLTQETTVDYRDEVIEFTVQPANINCRVEKDVLSEDYRRLSVAGDPSEVIQRRRNDVTLPTSDEVGIAQAGLLDLGYWRGFTGYVRTDSPLGALGSLGDHLMKRYRVWKSPYATRFVLTGETPEETSPLWTETGPTGEIVLHAAPWISSESVKSAYSRELWLRGWMSERYNWSKGPKAKRQRRLDDKTLKLLRFVTARMDQLNDPREKRRKGRQIAAEWDAVFAEWAYRGDTRTMWRDYNRALQSVASVAARNDSSDSNQTVTGTALGEQR